MYSVVTVHLAQIKADRSCIFASKFMELAVLFKSPFFYFDAVIITYLEILLSPNAMMS